jgi:D-threo-aldose 1-dehydrogenase
MSDQERGGKMSVRENLLAGPLGFGAAPLGKYVPKHPEDEAEATVDAAWALFRHGAVLCCGAVEIRLGEALSKWQRKEKRS